MRYYHYFQMASHSFTTVSSPQRLPRRKEGEATRIIRRALSTDARRIAEEMDRAAFGNFTHAWNKEKTSQQTALDVGKHYVMKNNGADSYLHFIVATIGDHVAGTAGILTEPIADFENNNAFSQETKALYRTENKAMTLKENGKTYKLLYLSIISVHASIQKSGFASTLMEAVVDEAKARGFDGISLLCNNTNETARKLKPHESFTLNEGSWKNIKKIS